MAKSPSKKAPGSLPMTISGTDAEMRRIKAAAAAHQIPVARLIHEAVTYYDKTQCY